MADRYNWEDLYCKIDYEGGVDEAIRYGIAGDDVPADIEDLWRSAVKRLNAYDEVQNEIWEILERNYDEDNGE